MEQNPTTRADIWTVPVEMEVTGLRAGTPEPFLQTPLNERGPMFSPDGRWMAYSSNESGALEVYVQAFPDKSGKTRISSGGGVYQSWSRDGRELFFTDVKNKRVMAASYTVEGGSFRSAQPRVWSAKEIATFSTTRTYDPAPDGKRVVALMPVEGMQTENLQSHVTLLLNFFDELLRRLPAEGN